MLELQLVGRADVERALQGLGRQLPFARAQLLNQLANAAQAETRKHVEARFTLRRRDFVLRTIYRKPGEDFATKAVGLAAVRINEERDFLAKFEEGGIKRPREGRSVAIPVDARRNKSDIVTPANRPRAILQRPRFTRTETRIVQRVGRGKAARQRVWYVLKRFVRIPARLGMVDAARRSTARDFDRLAAAAIDQALRTAR
jgi:hypothetical protein